MIRGAIFLVVTAIIVAGLITWAGGSDVIRLLSGVSADHLAAALLLTLILPITHAWRLQTVLAAAGYAIGQRRAFQLTMGAWPISSITPSKSGDLVKAYYLRHQIPATVTMGGLLAERAIDVAVLSVLAFIGSVVFGLPITILFSAALLGAILAFFLLAPWLSRLPLKPSWRNRIELLLSSSTALWRSPRAFTITVILTLTNWLVTFLVTMVLYDAVGASVPFIYVMAGLPPAVIAGLAPFTVGGMGTRDSILILLFEQYASYAQSLSVGIMYAFYFRWLLSLLGIPFLLRLTQERE